jgi:hypothetical protein
MMSSSTVTKRRFEVVTVEKSLHTFAFSGGGIKIMYGVLEG